jgi:glucuronate isomerase
MAYPIEQRYFSADGPQQRVAGELYARVKHLPLICPHGHVDPRILADPNYRFGSPVDLLIIPDHYIFRMLYSQGITLERLGIPRRDGAAVESDHRTIWRLVCENWLLFAGTPTGIWLRDELRDVFGIEMKISAENADVLYDSLAEKLQQDSFSPRRLFERFNIEVLATTDEAADSLEHHQAIRASGWNGRVIPTFRPDGVVNIDAQGWSENVRALGRAVGSEIRDYPAYIAALENRRAFFRSMGATATDHAAQSAYTEQLSAQEAGTIFRRALSGEASIDDARRFTGHMLIEMARMSIDDGLVMQLHVGSFRDHNPVIHAHFGRNMGADIPISAEFTRNLKPLLDRFGNHPGLRLILFNLDESTYSRELAPLAGHYPALRLGPPWWFFDSFNGMRRFFDHVVETAGVYNTVGFNDDTRAYPSIPARHDLWRRAAADWLAGIVVRQLIDEEDAQHLIRALAYDLAKEAYRLSSPEGERLADAGS